MINPIDECCHFRPSICRYPRVHARFHLSHWGAAEGSLFTEFISNFQVPSVGRSVGKLCSTADYLCGRRRQSFKISREARYG